jgi:Protein of unknown function (DUF3011)
MNLTIRILPLTFLCLLACLSALKPPQAHAQGQTIYCASDDGKRHSCGANTNGGVALTNQRSGSPCIQGQTWGWDNNGIWVDRGCRAEFASGSGSWNGNGGGSNNNGGSGTIYCASDDGRRHSCNANTRGGVQLTNQRSGSACTEGQTWGWDNNGIWVDRGCRAEFTVGNGRGGGHWGGGNNGGGNNGYGNNGSSTVSCSSDDGRRHTCSLDTRGGVRLVNQRSGSPCTEGQTWGWDNGSVWVDRGCRAEFASGGGGGGWRGSGSNGGVSSAPVYCASDDGKRHSCSMNTRGGVRLTNQRSGSACTEGQTWGWDNGSVWVDRGCRAEFQSNR